MQTSLRKMGNSTGLIVPKAILDYLPLEKKLVWISKTFCRNSR